MASVVEAGFGFGKLVEFLTTGRLGSLATLLNSLKIGYKTAGTRNGQAYKIIILFVANISRIAKREFRVN